MTVVRGLDELAAGLDVELRKLEGPEVKRALRVSAYAGAAKARDVVRERAPVKSGNLRKAVAAKRRKARGATLASAGVYVKPRGYYWKFVELGTEKMIAHPFIRPAFDANEDEIGDAVSDRLGKAIDEALTR